MHIYMDGTPDDWFSDRMNRTHTIALLFSPDDGRLNELIEQYEARLSGGLRQWKVIRGDVNRKRQLLDALFSVWNPDDAWLNVISFDEQSVYNSTEFLFSFFGEREIGFEILENGNWCHQYVDSQGLHVISDKPKKLLPLIFLSWLIYDMLAFYSVKLKQDIPSFVLEPTLTMNHLSGDGITFNGKDLFCSLLKYMGVALEVDSKKENRPLLMVDNVAGMLNQALSTLDWTQYISEEAKIFSWYHFDGVNEGRPILTALPRIV